MAMPTPGGIVNCQIPDVTTLYSSYLPFVKNGALYIRASQPKALGEDVFVAVGLPDLDQRLPLNGKVVWVNYRNSALRPSGYAVQFGEDSGAAKIKNHIQQLLSSTAGSDKPTFTL